MDEDVLIRARELDAAADRAGGYVVPPWESNLTENDWKPFSAMRQYSLQHKTPFSLLDPKDFMDDGEF